MQGKSIIIFLGARQATKWFSQNNKEVRGGGRGNTQLVVQALEAVLRFNKDKAAVPQQGHT